MPKLEWDAIPSEDLASGLVRRAIHTETMTVAEIALAAGVRVAAHSHGNEQISLVQSGRLRFRLGEQEILATPGSVVHIPSNLPHSVEAEEASVVIDIFSPRREDWIRGDDAYLRK